MQNHQTSPLTLPDSHLNGADDHLSVLPVMHRPTHDQLVEQIQHHAEKQLALVGLQLGNVGHPLGLRLKGQEVALQVIADTWRR